MAKRNNPNTRVNSKLYQDLDEIINTRIRNGLMKRSQGTMPKITELLTRTEGYRISLEELKSKPEKKK